MALTELDAAILRLLAAGETRSVPLAAALAAPVRSVQDRLGRLRSAGLVQQRRRGEWHPTGAGRRASLAASVLEPAASAASLDDLPAEHRALLRLIEDAVVARRSLRDAYADGWPAFVLLGPTKSGKTYLGRLAARRFGLDPVITVRLLMRETRGSLLGRRVQTSAGTWRIDPSPLLAMPLVTLDEFDKASPELQAAAFAYLEGASWYQGEDAMIALNATAIITLNAAERDPSRPLPAPYLRRSVVLDTAPLAMVTRDLDLAAAALARVALPVVSPDLVPPAASLPDYAWASLRALLHETLTAPGWELVDVEAVSRLVLGRWATLPDGLEQATAQVAADYLLVTDTRVGLVVPDWPLRFERIGPAAASATGVLAAARARHVVQEQQRVATVRAESADSRALAGERSRLLAALDHAIATAPRGRDLTAPERDAMARAVGVGHHLRVEITAARSIAALTELAAPLAAEVVSPLATVTGSAAARRWATEQARAQQRQRVADDRQQARERERAAQQDASAARRAVQARRSALLALCRRTAARLDTAGLAALVDAGCVTRLDEPYQAEPLDSRIGRLGHRVVAAARSGAASLAGSGVVAVIEPEPAPVYVTRTETWYVDRDGRRWRPGELVAWRSPALDAVLNAALVAEGLPPLTRPVQRRAPAGAMTPRNRRRGL